MKKFSGRVHYTPFQIFIIGLLVVLSILFMVSDNRFSWEDSGTPCSFSYVERGEYTLEIYYESAGQENYISVRSDAAVGRNGVAGIELAHIDLKPGEGGVMTIPLSLEQGIFDVRVETDLDTEDTFFVTYVILKSDEVIYHDGMFLGVFCLLTALALAFIFVQVPKEKYRMPLLAVGIGLLAGIPLYVEVVLGGNDFMFHLMRIEGIYRAMASGEFPVRINPVQTAGYGYLSATLYPQLFFYPAACLRFFGVSLKTCHKLLLVSANVGTALIAYYSVKNITKSEKIGIVMSFLYTLSAYRLTCMYMRVAVGELLALTFLPLVVWGVYECLWGQRRWIILTLGMTGVLGCHILSAELCAAFMILELVWWLCSRKKDQVKERFLSGIKAVVTTVFLNFSLLIPLAYFSTQDLYCFNMGNSIANSVVYFSQMFSLILYSDGYSVPRGTTMHDMPLTVGTALLIGLFVFWFWVGKERNKGERTLQWFGLHCAVYAVIAMLLTSWLMPWGAVVERIPLVSRLTASLQFVWRFLGPASLFLCVCASVGLVKLLEEAKELNWLAGVIVGLCLVSTWTLFDDLKNKAEQYLNPMDMSAMIYEDALYLYEGSNLHDYTREGAVPRTANGTKVEYSGYRKDGTHITMDVTPLEEGQDYLLLPLYYYPGYEIRVNGEKQATFNVDTLVACELPSGQSHIEVRYAGLPAFRIGDVITCFTVLGMIGFGLGKKKKI